MLFGIQTIASAQVATSTEPQNASTSTVEIVTAKDINWQALNPKRGDKGPRAGTLWGDQTGDQASGFLVKFVDGFSSPPHIHNITYRGIVLEGNVHNDDPAAKPMWMTKGSYWTQPAGEVHITSSAGASVAYVEIQSGPYLVMPPESAFDRGERPINIDASNVMWLDAANTTWIKTGTTDKATPQLAYLFGNPNDDQPNGSYVKLPAGFSGTIKSNGKTFRAVVIEGQTSIKAGDETKSLLAGSYFGSDGEASHQVSCDAECLVYVRSEGKFEVICD